MSCSVWMSLIGPTGTTSRPWNASCSIRAGGTAGTLAVTRIASNGAASGQPARAVAAPQRDAPVAQPVQRGRCALGLSGARLDAVDRGVELGQHRRLVATAGADLQHRLAGLKLYELGHQTRRCTAARWSAPGRAATPGRRRPRRVWSPARTGAAARCAWRPARLRRAHRALSPAPQPSAAAGRRMDRHADG